LKHLGVEVYRDVVRAFPPLISGGSIEAEPTSTACAGVTRTFPPLISGGSIEAAIRRSESRARCDFRR